MEPYFVERMVVTMDDIFKAIFDAFAPYLIAYGIIYFLLIALAVILSAFLFKELSIWICRKIRQPFHSADIVREHLAKHRPDLLLLVFAIVFLSPVFPSAGYTQENNAISSFLIESWEGILGSGGCLFKLAVSIVALIALLFAIWLLDKALATLCPRYRNA